MSIKRVDLRPQAKRAAASLEELIAREHRRVAKLTKKRDAIQRQLTRSRIRYGVLKRLANDNARRFQLGGEA